MCLHKREPSEIRVPKGEAREVHLFERLPSEIRLSGGGPRPLSPGGLAHYAPRAVRSHNLEDDFKWVRVDEGWHLTCNITKAPLQELFQRAAARDDPLHGERFRSILASSRGLLTVTRESLRRIAEVCADAYAHPGEFCTAMFGMTYRSSAVLYTEFDSEWDWDSHHLGGEQFYHSDTPAVLLDRRSRIMAWYLPGCFAEDHMVQFLFMNLLTWTDIYHRKLYLFFSTTLKVSVRS